MRFVRLGTLWIVIFALAGCIRPTTPSTPLYGTGVSTIPVLQNPTHPSASSISSTIMAIATQDTQATLNALATPNMLQTPTTAAQSTATLVSSNSTIESIGNANIEPIYVAQVEYPNTTAVELDFTLTSIIDQALPLQLVASLNCLERSFDGCTAKDISIIELNRNTRWEWILAPSEFASGRQHLRLEIFLVNGFGEVMRGNPVWQHSFTINVIQPKENTLFAILRENIGVTIGGIFTFLAALVGAGILFRQRSSSKSLNRKDWGIE